ncbi:PHB depolymerase family esterase [Caballeronia novacaledonica]|uniref:PHB depolymerase family esterase n=1 Tax=Caballeronia novacaledonica TaxID=1544861 RepID=A0A2U3I2L2_9BURK|nr:PHB depolymerase family esterase [Caballeronia novacaledonica]SPB14370.1 PHB depolymerase family esterase [Caballeronia novacaledonica]
MNPFHPLAWAHDSFWSLFPGELVGLTAHFFDNAEPAIAAPATELQSESEARTARVSGHGWSSDQFEYGNDTYRFKIYIPTAYEGRPLPMIVMLHGAQQDSDDFASGTGMNIVAEEQGFIAVYPEQPESSNPLKCWNWFLPANQTRASGEAAAIAALTREVAAAYNVDRARIYVAGMSAGGALAVNLAVTHPELYAAAAIHSGLAFGVADEQLTALCAMNDGRGKVRLPLTSSDEPRLRAVPLIVFHGDADGTVHPRNAEQIVSMSQLLHGVTDDKAAPSAIHTGHEAGGHAYTRQVFHDRDGDLIGEQWVVHGLGHAWSGGHPDGTHTDMRGPRASREIARFFGEFVLENSPPIQTNPL